MADSGQRECARGKWCAARTVVMADGQRVIKPALGPRAFCSHDQELIVTCLGDLPGIYLRLEHELHRPLTAETHVHVPFGPSISVRLDVDAAMWMTARTLNLWTARSAAQTSNIRYDPLRHIHDPAAVRDAARALADNINVLLALQDEWQTFNEPVPPGRTIATSRGVTATCVVCGRRISYSAVGKRWWAADSDGAWWMEHDHQPVPETIVAPPPALIPADIEDEHPDTRIVRFGADFVGLFIQRDGAAAGLDFLHLHYWGRAVLLETPAQPEELIGVECRSCSLLTLRRAELPWFSGDPVYYSECADCGDLMNEDDYREWVALLHAYHRARQAAVPTLAEPPSIVGGVAGHGGRA